MIIIPQCRFCNADKDNCFIRMHLKTGTRTIQQRLVHRCKEWIKYAKYKIGDFIEFHFIEEAVEEKKGWTLSGETLDGDIIKLSDKKPIYFVKIDKANRSKIDPEYHHYDKYVYPFDILGPEDQEFYVVPVKEEFIINLKSIL